MVISEFAVKLGLDKGPGALTVEEKAAWEKTLLSVWQSTNLLSSNRIEMFIPQNIKLTDPMKTALSDLRKHKGQDVIECKEYSGESHLQRLLMQSAPQGVSRIIVSERTLKNMNIGKLAEENPALFVGVRLVNIALPAVYDTMDVREKSIHQSKLIMFTILARLYEGNKTSAVGVLLQAMLKDMLDIDTDTGEFMTKLVESQDESSDPIRAKDRILYCLSKVVGLVEKLGTEIRLMKEFWTAA